VANYRSYDAGSSPVKGKFALWFEDIYREISGKASYKGMIPFEADEVNNGYFSQDKRGKWSDTKGNTLADDDTFKLIMKDKERLLDVNEPLRFIFSHSALREGWDNPNVFQICTLNETH
jgi:type III restriction enzyme